MPKGVPGRVGGGSKGPPMNPTPLGGVRGGIPNRANIAHGPAHKARAISRTYLATEGLGVQCKRHCP